MKKIGFALIFILSSYNLIAQITVTSPNGGERYVSGTNQVITWSGSSGTGSFYIYLTRDNGATTQLITTIVDTFNLVRSYNWTVFYLNNTNCKIIVADNNTGTSLSDMSNAPFTIVNPIPVANFTSRVASCDGLKYSFVDQSTNMDTGAVRSWSWDFGDGSTSSLRYPNHTFATANTYNVSLTVFNAYGQNSKSVPLTVTASSATNPVIQGSATYSGGNITSGAVLAYDIYNINDITNEPVTAVGYITNGSYSINLPNGGSYKLLFSITDTLSPGLIGSVASTYYNNTTSWSNATVINTTCGAAAITVNNVLVTVNAFNPPGSATISGAVLDYSGARMGDPLPGVDVSLEQNPGSNLRVITTTDGNGNYQFGQVPVGNYSVKVNIPGNNQVQTRQVVISGTETESNVDYFVDDFNNIVTFQPSGIRNTFVAEKELFSYLVPNPNNGVMSINTGDWSDKSFMQVYNVAGELVYSANVSNNKMLDLSFLKDGLYLVKLSNNAETISQKIIIRK